MASIIRPLALVTGATQGIGREVARQLATKHDYHVIVGARNPETAAQVVEEIKKTGHEASTVKMDLTSPSSLQEAIATIEKDYGYLDVLVNNAGHLLDTKTKQLGLNTWELYDQTFKTNVIGTATLTDGLLPLLRKAKCSPPRIVFVTSTMGSLKISSDKTTPFYNIDYTAYDASKAATNMLMLNYDRILADFGGKSNAVCPGLVKTALNGFMEWADTPELGATRIVEMATINEDGPSGTMSDRNGPIPW